MPRHEQARPVPTGPGRAELTEADLERVQAGKGGNSNGGDSPLTRVRARFLDEISIHLVPA